MNTAPLKSYAPAARRAFIAAVTAQAARLGITPKEIAPATVQGDVLLVNGQPFPRSAETGRMSLVRRVKNQGFESTMDAVAYTWFNRLVAIRYMELHNYLDHGYRVLSDPGGLWRPEILDKAAEVELSGLDRAKVVQLKLDGTRDEELYRMLLIAQCNALHKAMPFLFEKIGDETELLLPANLLHTDSLIRQLVESIEESAWQQIEIIGWLYQFYISEKKAQVIGKVVKSEDIPAATQLFTPNWIVKYMVQNSLGAQWLATYPNSPLKAQMEYYIEPAEQTEEVKAQLAAITPESLNPEEITLIDPACGSGHILVEAYDLFKAIYVERGYRERDAARLILTKNLYGLDIDPRAAQLSGFALMMKGRADDRRLFEGPTLNVMAMVNGDELNIAELTHEVRLAHFGLVESDLRELKKLFDHATTFGTLIQVPSDLAKKLPRLRTLSETTVGEVGGEAGDMFAAGALEHLTTIVRQAEILAMSYDIVVANPPYMGTKGMNDSIKSFASKNYDAGKGDLFACFIMRGFDLIKPGGFHSMVTLQSWMFLPTFKRLRKDLLATRLLLDMTHMETGVMGIAFGTAATVLRNVRPGGYLSSFSYVASADLGPGGNVLPFPPANDRRTHLPQDELNYIDDSPVAYWISNDTRRAFANSLKFEELAGPCQGMATTNNERFLRRWSEVNIGTISFDAISYEQARESPKRWFPYNKGGPFRKWYGNHEFVVNFYNGGEEICNYIDSDPKAKVGSNGRVINRQKFFLPGITWTTTSSSYFGVRFTPPGFIFDVKGSSSFPQPKHRPQLLALLASNLAKYLLDVLNPTTEFQVGNIGSLPVIPEILSDVSLRNHATFMIDRTAEDWDYLERSWRFTLHPLLTGSRTCVNEAWTDFLARTTQTVAECLEAEREINKALLAHYGLESSISSEVLPQTLTLTTNPAYRYGSKGTAEERQTQFREDTIQELVSYAVGCMMGRYSLDEPGLIYAHSGNAGFESSRYSKFPCDEDGIIPVTDSAWFEDDAATRLEEFLSVAWDKAHLEENLIFLADNLSPNRNETSRDTIRRYLGDKFFKDHLQTYKNRPIYWLFTSGKQKAFQCLVYLHRYNEGTLARMRSEYVIPLQGKMAARLAHLAEDRVSASAAQQKRIDKEATKLKKQHAELLEFDEKLRHYADRRISLDLDDGVKVNYGKFGSLLAEVTTVHGQKAEGP